jgi:precorrin-3B methylase
MFSGADTQNTINAFAAQAFGASPYGKEIAPGQSAGPGLTGALAPQIGKIGASINTASTSIPMYDKLANQKWQLANEQMRAQAALGQAGMAGSLYDMIQQDRMNKINDLFGLIGGLLR